MTLQQTVTIPADRRIHLDLSLPEMASVGPATLILEFPIKAVQAEEEWVNPLLGLCEDSSLTIERFLEMRHEEAALEEERHERLWGVR